MGDQSGQKAWWALTWREYLALLLAGVWDVVQVAFFPVTSPGVVSPFNLGGSVIVSLVLALLMGPSLPLLPAFILENVPLFNQLPNTLAGVAFIIWQRRKQIPPPLSRNELQ